MASPWDNFDPTAGQAATPALQQGNIGTAAPNPGPVQVAPLPNIPGSKISQFGQGAPAADPWANFAPAGTPTPVVPPPAQQGSYWGNQWAQVAGGAWDKLVKDYQESRGPNGLNASPTGLGDWWHKETTVPRLLGDAVNVGLSPFSTILHGAVVQPVAEGMSGAQDAMGLPVTRSPGIGEVVNGFRAGKPSPFAQVPILPSERQARNEGQVNASLLAFGPGEAPATVAGVLKAPDVPAAGVLTPVVSPKAAKYIGGLLGKPDPVMVAAHEAGKPVTTAEMLGPQGRTALAATARRAGTSGPAVEDVMSARVESTPDTMLSDFQKHTGIAPEAARGDMEGLAEANRAGSVRPAYQAALAQPVTMTPELANVLQEPEVITAVNQAKRLVGQNATTMGIKIDPATGAPVLDPLTMKPVLEEQPTAATLDQAKKFLAKGITRNPITGAPVTSGAGASENVFIQQHLGNLTDALAGNPDKNIAPAIPGYREALDAAGDTLKMEQAFKLGQDHILNPRVAAADVQAQVAKMSPSEIQAYQGGQANTLFAKAQNGLLAPKKLMTPAVRSKLAATLGPDKADAFLTDIKHTQAMLNNARQIAPQAGSQTAPLSAEMKAQDNPGGLRGILGGAAQDFIMGTVAGGGHPAMGLHLAGLNVGRKVSGLLGDFVNEKTMPVGVRNEVGGILGATGEGAMTPDQLAALIKAQKSQKALPPKVPALTWVGRPDKPSLGILGAPATGFVAGSAQQR